MTREMKRAILEEALVKAYSVVETTPGDEMGSEDFQRLLHAIDTMQFIHGVQLCEDSRRPTPEDDFSPEATQPSPVQVNATKPEPEEPVKESPSADREETIKYDKPTVRAALQGLRQKGINANAIIQKLGYENFPAVPETKYAELMVAIEEAS